VSLALGMPRVGLLRVKPFGQKVVASQQGVCVCVCVASSGLSRISVISEKIPLLEVVRGHYNTPQHTQTFRVNFKRIV